MVSESPLPDRCGATVTTKIGFELYDSVADETYTTEDRLEELVVVRDSEESHIEPSYADVLDYTHNGFDITAVNLRPSEASEDEAEDDELIRVEIEDDDPDTTHTDNIQEGYCERYQMDNGRCYVHGGVSGGAPEGNTHAATHYLHAKRSSYYEQLSEKEKGIIQELADSWIDNAPFDRDNKAKVSEIYRIAIDQHRLWGAHEKASEGMTTEQIVGVDDGGDPIEVEEENPVNLAYDRLDRTTFRKLKDLGALDDPDSQQAEAVESLADKFANIDGG